MTTKKSLMNFQNYFNPDVYPSFKLYSCKASFRLMVSYTSKEWFVLKSYNTDVAIFSPDTSTLYVFDNYSATTYQHIYKFARRMNAMRITWLFRRYDSCIETAISYGANTFKLTKNEFDELEKMDFAPYIESL